MTTNLKNLPVGCLGRFQIQPDDFLLNYNNNLVIVSRTQKTKWPVGTDSERGFVVMSDTLSKEVWGYIRLVIKQLS